MVECFHAHHRIVKAATRISIMSPSIGRALVWSLRQLVQLESERSRQIASQPALSIIYSILYHQGVAEELSGKLGPAASFRELLRSKTITR